MEHKKKDFKYYAFISYSHKDKKAADWIHKKLTFYRLPSFARQELRKDIKLRPICKDEHSLPPGELWKMICEKLDASRYLIVVCSPNSAFPNISKEHWVDREVEYFAATHGTENIIPVIVDGKVNDGKNECFCPALKKLNLLALDMTLKENPKKKILNFLAAKLLNLDPDILYDYAKQEIKKKFKFRFLFMLPLILLVLSGGFFAYDSTRTVENYYADYINSYGLPEGIFKLTKEQTLNRTYHYRFEYQGYRFGKSIHADSSDWSIFRIFGMQRVLRKVIQANSAGTPIYSIHTEYARTRVPIQIFKYDDDKAFWAKKLTAVSFREECGKNGKILMTLEYSDTQDNDGLQGAINGQVLIKKPDNKPMKLKSFSDDQNPQAVIQNTNDKQNPIVGYRMERDRNGRVTKQIYLDAYNRYTCDEHGILAAEHQLDTIGRITKIWYLKKNGNIWERQENQNGVAGKFFEYFNENMTLIKYVNSKEMPVYGPDGWMICKEFYADGNGNNYLTLFKNEKGEISPNKKHNISGMFCEFDTGGNLIKQIAISGKKDENNNYIPVCRQFKDPESGKISNNYAGVTITRDQAGRIKTLSYSDKNGNPCINLAEGYHLAKYTYFADGTLESYRTYDIKEQPSADINGSHCIAQEYYNSGELQKVIITAPDGQGGVWGYENIHKVIKFFNKNGNEIDIYYYDVNGNPAVDDNGIHHRNNLWENDINIQSTFYAPDGQGNIWGYKNVHKAVRIFNENRNTAKESYYDTEGNPATDHNGIHRLEIIWENNKKIQQTSYAADGQDGLLGCKNIYKAINDFDQNGNTVKECYYDTEGKPAVNSDGIHCIEYIWENNKKIRQISYAADGHGGLLKCKNIYKMINYFDRNANMIKECYYDKKGNPAVDSIGTHYFEVTWEDGRITQIIIYAPEGQGGIYGQANINKSVKIFDKNNNIIKESYYDTKGKPAVTPDGIHRIENIWEDGRITQTTIYAPEGQGGIYKYANIQKTIQYFDKDKNLIRESLYDKDGRQTVDADGIHRIENIWKDGRITQKILCAPDGQGGIYKCANIQKTIQYFDKDKNLIKESVYDKDGRQTVTPDGIHRIENIWENGRITKKILCAPDGQGGVLRNRNVNKMILLFDSNNNMIESQYFGLDGKRALSDKGYSRRKNIYDGNNLIDSKFFDQNDNIVNIEFKAP